MYLETETIREVLTHGTNTERFGRVVTPKQNMYSELCRIEKRVMGAFTGYICVQPDIRGLSNIRSATASHHADRPDELGPPGRA